MKLVIILPTRVLCETAVTRVVADAENGSFCLLPRHIDTVMALARGLITFVDTQGTERFAAVDGGILVKCGDVVWVIAQRVVIGDQLEDMQRTVADEFRIVGERERLARSAMARLEAGLVRGMLEAQRRL